MVGGPPAAFAGPNPVIMLRALKIIPAALCSPRRLCCPLQVKCYHRRVHAADRDTVFRLQFHTCTVHGSQLWFGKGELDEACTGERARHVRGGQGGKDTGALDVASQQ